MALAGICGLLIRDVVTQREALPRKQFAGCLRNKTVR
jgi:hypothetical protein